MEYKLTASPSPHIHSRASNRRIMLDVLIALAPAFAVTVWIYGARTVAVMAVSVTVCMLCEFLIGRYVLRSRNTLGDLSAVVTGTLLAFNLPSSLPLWMVALGALVAIGVGKMSFGGVGRNPFNPALVGRVFLFISFLPAMTSFPAVADANTGATPLSFVREALHGGKSVSQIMPQIHYSDLLLGFRSGSMGEIAALALLAGGVYLLARRVIRWNIPVCVLGSMAVFSTILWSIDPEHYMSPLFHLLTGGAILGAIFMATDYSTSPMTPRGMAIFGIGIGVITMLIRTWGAYPEGVSFAILIMNAVVPLIDKYVKPRRFAAPQKKIFMKSTLRNMVLSLGVITLVGAAAVGLVYRLTKGTIDRAAQSKQIEALALVLPPFEGTPKIDSMEVAGTPARVYTASKGGQVVGYAVESMTTRGYGGNIRLMTGFTPSGDIIRIQVLEEHETPGLGDKIRPGKSDFSVQFEGHSPATLRMSVRKDGGDVDAITGSTISSRAFIDAVQHAWDAMQSVKTGTAPPADVNTGATSINSAPQAPCAEPKAAAVRTPTAVQGANAGNVQPKTNGDATRAAAKPRKDSTASKTDTNTGATSLQK